MARTETVEFTNMCMICDGSRVVVIDRKKRDWPGITFPGGHIETGESFTDGAGGNWTAYPFSPALRYQRLV